MGVWDRMQVIWKDWWEEIDKSYEIGITILYT